MAGYQEMDPGGVPAPYFEAVDSVQGDVDRVCDGQRAGRAVRSDQVRHGLRGRDPIPGYRPLGVFDCDERSVDRFEFRGRHATFIESGLDLRYVIGDPSTGRGQLGSWTGRIKDRSHARDATQCVVDIRELTSNAFKALCLRR